MTDSWAASFVEAAHDELVRRADPTRVQGMTTYMRGQFPFLGVMAAGQREAGRAARLVAGKPPDELSVVAAVDALWAHREREHRYLGCDVVRRWAPSSSATFVDEIARWITDGPWWDTCDPLSRRGVGVVVRHHPELRSTMDAWLVGDDLWLTRTALLHMGTWKEAIDREWVFAACLAQAHHTDFFVRKAIGWILRDLASVDVEAVRAFVTGPGAELSGLSRREALKRR